MDAEATVAILTLAATLITQIVFRSRDLQAERKREVLRHRRDALHTALRVIDLVFLNSDIQEGDRKIAAANRSWDIALAREAMNKMILYCEDPQTSVHAFTKVIGLRDNKPEDKQTRVQDLAIFRGIVQKELGIEAKQQYQDDRVQWIVSLPGGVTAPLPPVAIAEGAATSPG